MKFEIVLQKCNNKSPRPDDILFSFIHNLPNTGKTYLLQIFDLIWSSGTILLNWKYSFIISIPKEGKDKYNTEYCPICLLHIMCKFMEKIINLQLIWFIEQINYLSPDQNGFRHQPNFSLIQIQSEIINAMYNK